MEQIKGTHEHRHDLLTRFFVREDPTYDRWERTGQPQSAFGKGAYLALYFLPGLFAALVINVPAMFFAELRITHLSPRYLQFGCL